MLAQIPRRLLDLHSLNTPRRLVFGHVAELYDRSRPSYPEALIDDLLGLAILDGGRRALEVGAGTGKATRLMAARGVPVLAIEPSPEMAAVARRTCADDPDVQIVESDFEAWDPAGERFGLVCSATAWHWVDAAVGYECARRALTGGGVLAAFWNRPMWGDSALRRDLSRVYREHAPEISTDNPYHPDHHGDEMDWDSERAAAAGFGPSQTRRYEWQLDYSATEFADLLATLSMFRLLADDAREALLAAIREVVVAHGDQIEVPMQTIAVFARAVAT